MTAPLDHIQEASACLVQSYGEQDNSDTERSLLGRASAHALLAIAERLPPTMPEDVVEAEIADVNPLHTAAELLEWAAIAGEGDQRERTIARLMLHATGERYADAPNIAEAALDGTTGTQHYAVAQAIIALRIELPV